MLPRACDEFHMFRGAELLGLAGVRPFALVYMPEMAGGWTQLPGDPWGCEGHFFSKTHISPFLARTGAQMLWLV